MLYHSEQISTPHGLQKNDNHVLVYLERGILRKSEHLVPNSASDSAPDLAPNPAPDSAPNSAPDSAPNSAPDPAHSAPNPGPDLIFRKVLC